ncbi:MULTISPECIES: DUF2231 domain-containing protein [unclassified Luteimonas]|uniref:DUF2231 domain-containing protein n=1 Tax=unclassified Luteimonas TaxID=2629088 RepID=UPI001603B98D|nr:hypothetical protein [Luteimonas sp. MC1782]MBB6600278.1 hypothetical protein [Luteimonas sp. MC1825]QOC87960.1 hypothetical protein IDM46_12170 [Luteimonas sp. MC1825]
MAVAAERRYQRAIHPLHAFLLAAAFPLFLGAMVTDIAYGRTFEIQWSNFASWLLAGALVFAACALLWSVVDYFRGDRGTRPLVYMLLLLATWVVGFIASLVHARDAFAMMPTGLVLSVIATVLAGAAAYLGFSAIRVGDRA